MNANWLRKVPEPKMSKNYLVTGVAGSGKSTLEAAFNSKGCDTYDIDRGYAQWRHIATNEPVAYNPQGGEQWAKSHDWLVRASEFTQLLHTPSNSPRIIFGSAGDLHNYAPLFTKIILLEYPSKSAIAARLATRTNNPYGKQLSELQAVYSYYMPYQEQMKALGAIALDCTAPLTVLTQEIEAVFNDN